jgi:GTP-binding protein HflX
LLQIVDAADPSFEAQMQVTGEVLDEIGAGDRPRVVVFNKADRVDAERRAQLAEAWPDALVVSSRDPEDVARVRDRILAHFERDMIEAELFVPYAQQRWVSEIYASARVLSERHGEAGTHLLIRARPQVWERLRGALGTG